MIIFMLYFRYTERKRSLLFVADIYPISLLSFSLTIQLTLFRVAASPGISRSLLAHRGAEWNSSWQGDVLVNAISGWNIWESSWMQLGLTSPAFALCFSNLLQELELGGLWPWEWQLIIGVAEQKYRVSGLWWRLWAIALFLRSLPLPFYLHKKINPSLCICLLKPILPDGVTIFDFQGHMEKNEKHPS